MIHRRTKNAEIFRDTEHKYKSDSELIAIIKNQLKIKCSFPKNQQLMLP